MEIFSGKRQGREGGRVGEKEINTKRDGDIESGDIERHKEKDAEKHTERGLDRDGDN